MSSEIMSPGDACNETVISLLCVTFIGTLIPTQVPYLLVGFMTYHFRLTSSLKQDYDRLQEKVEHLQIEVDQLSLDRRPADIFLSDRFSDRDGDSQRSFIKDSDDILRVKREVISPRKVDLDSLIRGAPGPIGPPGPPGKDGRDGKDYSSLTILRDVIGKEGKSDENPWLNQGVKTTWSNHRNLMSISLPFHDVTFFDLTTVKSQNYVYVSTVGLNKAYLGPSHEWNKLSDNLPNYGGATYIRWGRSTCPVNSDLIYQGQMTGPDYFSAGGGSNYQCLPDDPEYDPLAPSGVAYSSLKPAWYHTIGPGFKGPLFKKNVAYSTVPCAACETKQRVTQIMIPAKIRCPSDWTLDYKGYVMAEAEGDIYRDPPVYFKTNHFRSSYVCVDADAEPSNKPTGLQGGAPIFPVAANCAGANALSNCPPYKADRTALSCVVCSK